MAAAIERGVIGRLKVFERAVSAKRIGVKNCVSGLFLGW
jgi:hypothetical protein